MSVDPRSGAPLVPGDPDEVGGWQLLRRLGSGGMGVVYLASRDGQLAALKTVAPELSADPDFRARFRREIQLCSRVHGEDVARVLDADADAPIAWLATDYVAGPTLDQWVRSSGRLAEADLHTLAAGLARALDQVHSHGVVHRDVKPSNVILTESGPVLIDLGVAIAQDSTSLTSTGTVVGSAGWMAPEQVRGMEATGAVDVFSWGATVAYAASGVPPYGTGRPEAIAYRVVHERPALMGLPTNLARVVAAGMASRPEDRPTAAALVQMLESPETGSPTAVPTAVGATVVDAADEHQRAEVGLASSPSNLPTGRRRVAFIGIVGALAAVAFASAYLVGLRSEPAIEQTAGPEPSTSPTSTTGTAENAEADRTRDADPTTEENVPPTTTAPSPPPEAEELNVVVDEGEDPPPIPTELQGWRQVGPLESTTVRVFDSQPFTAATEIGPSWNSCSDGFWTARWRAQAPGTVVGAAVGFSALVDPTSSEYTTSALEGDPLSGAAGYMSGFICMTPVFTWGSSSSGSTLADVIVEWQRWEPAV